MGKHPNSRKSADGIPAPHTMGMSDEKRRVTTFNLLNFNQPTKP